MGIVRNYPKLDEFLGVGTADYSERPPNVVYVGVLSEERSIYEMIDCMPLVAERYPNARLLLGGVYSAGTKQAELEKRPGWTYVDFLGWQSREQLIEQLKRSRIGLIVFHPAGNYREALSVKMFEYMAAGLPSVVSDFPINRDIANRHSEFGKLVEPRSPTALATSIVQLLDQVDKSVALGNAGRQMVETHFNWANEAAVLIQIYKTLTG
ncbi:MAG: glycosyltransferase [Pseudomonadota bacterium]